MDKKKKLITGIIALCFGFIAGLFVFYTSSMKPTGSAKEEIVVDIPSGSSGNQIIDILDNNGLIKNKTCAKIHLKMNKYAFQSNAYILNKGMDLEEILTILQGKEFKYISNTKLTIIDGSTIVDNAKNVAKALEINTNDVLSYWSDTNNLKAWQKDYWFLTDEIYHQDIYYALEGYFAPETYFLSKSDDLASTTKMMLDQMKKNLDPHKEAIEAFKIKAKDFSIHEFLTLCSVVQRESPSNDDDRRMIAGILVNRLNKPMRLQCDATVNYGNQEVKIAVKHADLQSDNKYNTYKYDGLPVGPISAVGVNIVEDVLNYKESDYYYFFTTQEGKALYTKTFDEHKKVVSDNKWY